LGNEIFNADGDGWRHQRSTANFEFASHILCDYTMVIFGKTPSKMRISSQMCLRPINPSLSTALSGPC
jgi:hypothetical protein